MIDPCKHCAHVNDCGKIAFCLTCKWAIDDRFSPAADCATCRFDPRQNWICSRCVDNDQWTSRKVNSMCACGHAWWDHFAAVGACHKCACQGWTAAHPAPAQEVKP